LDTNGNLYVVLPDGDEEIVTRGWGISYYTFGLTAQKYLSHLEGLFASRFLLSERCSRRLVWPYGPPIGGLYTIWNKEADMLGGS